jgi:hypothetical protein
LLTRSTGLQHGAERISTPAALAVAVTEFGSDCDIYAYPSCKDSPYLRDFALYMNNTGKAAEPEFAHSAVNVW